MKNQKARLKKEREKLKKAHNLLYIKEIDGERGSIRDLAKEH